MAAYACMNCILYLIRQIILHISILPNMDVAALPYVTHPTYFYYIIKIIAMEVDKEIVNKQEDVDHQPYRLPNKIKISIFFYETHGTS